MECTYSVGWTCHYFELLYFEYVIYKQWVLGSVSIGWLWQPPVFLKKVFVGGNLMWRLLKSLYSHLVLEWRGQAHSKFTQSEFLLFGLAEEFHGILNYIVHGPSMVVESGLQWTRLPPGITSLGWEYHWHRYLSLLQVFIHLQIFVIGGGYTCLGLWRYSSSFT
jgi:hypothetical protein